MHAVFPADLVAEDSIMVPLIQVGIWWLPEFKEFAKFTQLVKGNAGNLS